MALNVGNNTSNFLSSTNEPAAYPFATHVVFKTNSMGADHGIWSSFADSSNKIELYVASDNLLHLNTKTGGSNSDIFVNSFTINDGTWYQALVVAISATERYLWLLGVVSETDTTSRAISAYTDTRVGHAANVSFDGLIQEVATWKGFTGNPFADQSLRFGLGLSKISPLSFGYLIPFLTSYQNLFNSERALVGPDFTVNGSVSYEPGRGVYLPRGAMTTLHGLTPEGPHKLRDLSDTLALSETLLRTLAISDSVALTERLRIGQFVEDTIELDETTFNDKVIDVTDFVTLSDLAAVPPGGRDSISLTDTAAFIRSGEREASDSIALHESISYILNRDCPECCHDDQTYSLTVGTHNSGNPTPPSTTVPTLTPGSITLSHPFTSPTLTLEMKRPLFGNRDRLTNQRINRESRGGTLIIYSDPQWPKVHTLVWEFSNLNEATAQDYLDFLAATLGDEIRLTDHEGRDWRGLIIQPDDPITRNKRCDLSASLTFEGELV